MAEHDARPFIILTSQRSGSAWLVSVLNNVEGVQAYGELFLGRPRPTGAREWDSDFAHPRFVERDEDLPRRRPMATFAYLDQLWARPGLTGFKLMYSQLQQFPEIIPHLLRRRVPVIHLVRNNHLDVVVSGTLKDATGQAHPLQGQQRRAATIEVRPDLLLRQMRDHRRNVATMRRVMRVLPLRQVEIAYEDLAADAEAFGTVWRFLDLPQVDRPRSDLARARSSSHEQTISNYADVRAALVDSEFAHLVD